MTDGSKEQPKMTAGLDLGDRYSYLCIIDQESGEVIEEGRLRTSPETFQRRVASERPLRIAIEASTHSPWGLAECSKGVVTTYLWPTHANCGSSTPISAKRMRSTP